MQGRSTHSATWSHPHFGTTISFHIGLDIPLTQPMIRLRVSLTHFNQSQKQVSKTWCTLQGRHCAPPLEQNLTSNSLLNLRQRFFSSVSFQRCSSESAPSRKRAFGEGGKCGVVEKYSLSTYLQVDIPGHIAPGVEPTGSCFFLWFLSFQFLYDVENPVVKRRTPSEFLFLFSHFYIIPSISPICLLGFYWRTRIPHCILIHWIGTDVYVVPLWNLPGALSPPGWVRPISHCTLSESDSLPSLNHH